MYRCVFCQNVKLAVGEDMNMFHMLDKVYLSLQKIPAPARTYNSDVKMTSHTYKHIQAGIAFASQRIISFTVS